MIELRKIDADHYFNVYLHESYDDHNYMVNYKIYNPPYSNDFYLICYDRKGGYYYDTKEGWRKVGIENIPSCLTWIEAVNVISLSVL